jgi:hypothetical protein
MRIFVVPLITPESLIHQGPLLFNGASSKEEERLSCLKLPRCYHNILGGEGWKVVGRE